MDLFTLGGHFARTVGQDGNSTVNASVPRLPLLEAVIPGYDIISRFFIDYLGFDISILVSLFALCLGLTKASSWIWLHCQVMFETYCMSKVHIDCNDDLFEIILKWLATHQMARSSTAVRAKTQKGSAWDEDSDEIKAAESAIDEHGNFNYGKWQARVPPRYEPHYGRNRFWHKSSYFSFNRKLKPQQSFFGNGDEDEIELSCVGWSVSPIKRLLQEMKVWSIETQMSKTSIRHATSKSSRGGMRWSITNARPSRPISTVILDDTQKQMIINDMNEFLHPSSSKWYATRGIPYRRGYLFHGPPGTGKTSLSFALAGIFGLDLYCFSLNDPDLTEGDLRDLFNWLPRRCIVLLEDIDEAGIKRPDHKNPGKLAADAAAAAAASASTAKVKEIESGKTSRRDSAVEDKVKEDAEDKGADSTNKSSEKASDETGDKITNETGDKSTEEINDKATDKSDDKTTKEAKSTAETQWTLQDLAKAIMAVSKSHVDSYDSEPSSPHDYATSHGSRSSRRRPKNPFDMDRSKKDDGISLSGLLNAIDGVATHEGRVLIMTTNHPETLDEALVRTGRVDLRIKFDFASGDQIRQLFLRMYAVDVNEVFGRAEDLDLFEKEVDNAKAKAALEEIACDFAEKVPDREFSPSDVQGYLLMHKKTPRAALAGVEQWIVDERKRQAEKKVKDEQEKKEKEEEEKKALEKKEKKSPRL
ncbi:P-loop containing nucleoside triphosphate hydrolase protein [Myriangium duriaei CBS 260.36]|uniref:P-loop containing nucleoside triphosphate hydrolase protein n=1 Tax=Myriangium duriaei CBS 260.36 TaxID=1168546 RepID=A0A9P4J8Z6_9PEZI|nr:P-loop containing nucleoside triphosphate hydrolase protein [Myriangium duriaei CBS 260.36]